MSVDDQFDGDRARLTDATAFEVPVRFFIEPPGADRFRLRRWFLGEECSGDEKKVSGVNGTAA